MPEIGHSMYHVHFGLEKRVFDDGIAQDAAVFLGARQQNIVADCSVALSSSDSVVVLTGRPGTGKTTLAGTALRTTSTRLALGALNGGAIGTVDLLEWLLTEFGFARERGTRAERLQTWRQFLSEASTTGSRVFIVVERAEDLGVEGLRSLAALTASDLNGCPGANLLLLGDEDLHELLGARELEALRQRIRLRHTLEPLTEDELALYVGHHVTQAGGEPMQLFPPETLAVLHAYSDGIPRLVNNLAETAASVAATQRATHVTPAVVEEVARKFLGLKSLRETGRAAGAASQTIVQTAVDDAAPATPIAASAAPSPVVPVASAAPIASTAQVASLAPATALAPSAVTAAPAPAAQTSPTAQTARPAPTQPGAAASAATNAADRAVADDVDDADHADDAEGADDEEAATRIAPALNADGPGDLPVLTDAVEPPAGDDRAPAEANQPRAAADDGYDDVEALPDMGAAMAETLFGDSDLDMLGAALAAGSWEEVENPADALAGLGRTSFAAVSSDDDDLAAFATAARSS